MTAINAAPAIAATANVRLIFRLICFLNAGNFGSSDILGKINYQFWNISGNRSVFIFRRCNAAFFTYPNLSGVFPNDLSSNFS